MFVKRINDNSIDTYMQGGGLYLYNVIANIYNNNISYNNIVNGQGAGLYVSIIVNSFNLLKLIQTINNSNDNYYEITNQNTNSEITSILDSFNLTDLNSYLIIENNVFKNNSLGWYAYLDYELLGINSDDFIDCHNSFDYGLGAAIYIQFNADFRYVVFF